MLDLPEGENAPLRAVMKEGNSCETGGNLGEVGLQVCRESSAELDRWYPLTRTAECSKPQGRLHVTLAFHRKIEPEQGAEPPVTPAKKKRGKKAGDDSTVATTPTPGRQDGLTPPASPDTVTRTARSVSPDRKPPVPKRKLVRSATSGALRGRDLKTGELVSPDPKEAGLSKAERAKYLDSPERNYERERAWKKTGRLSGSQPWQQTLYPGSNFAQRDTWGQLRPGVVRASPKPKPKPKPKLDRKRTDSFGSIVNKATHVVRAAEILKSHERRSSRPSQHSPSDTQEPQRKLERQSSMKRVSLPDDQESSYSSSTDHEDDEVDRVLGGYSPAGRRTCLLTFVGPGGLIESEGQWPPEKSAARAKDLQTHRGRLSCLNLYVTDLDTRSPERSRESSPVREPLSPPRRHSASRERRQSRDHRDLRESRERRMSRDSSRERLPRDRRDSTSPTADRRLSQVHRDREGTTTTGNVYERYAEVMIKQVRPAFSPDPRA